MGTFAKNSDGLHTHYGTRSADDLANRVAGESNKISYNIIGEDLVDNPASSDANKSQYVRGAVVPSGALITSAKIFVTEAFTSSGAAVLDVGTYNASTGAAIDDDGIDAAVAISSVLDTAGEAITCDGAQVAGASGGTALTANAIVVASYDTAAFTAGAARLEVEYIIPKNS